MSPTSARSDPPGHAGSWNDRPCEQGASMTGLLVHKKCNSGSRKCARGLNCGPPWWRRFMPPAVSEPATDAAIPCYSLFRRLGNYVLRPPEWARFLGLAPRSRGRAECQACIFPDKLAVSREILTRRVRPTLRRQPRIPLILMVFSGGHVRFELLYAKSCVFALWNSWRFEREVCAKVCARRFRIFFRAESADYSKAKISLTYASSTHSAPATHSLVPQTVLDRTLRPTFCGPLPRPEIADPANCVR